MPGVDENRYAIIAIDSASLSLGAETITDHRGFSRVKSDHPVAPCRGVVVSAEAGFVESTT